MSDLRLLIVIPVLDGLVQISIYEGAFLVDLCRDYLSVSPVEMVINLHANIPYADFLFECLSV